MRQSTLTKVSATVLATVHCVYTDARARRSRVDALTSDNARQSVRADSVENMAMANKGAA